MIVTNSLTGGGAERSMNLVANEMMKRGQSVALVPINTGPSDHVIPTCDVFPLGRKWRSGFSETICALWKFNSLVRKWKPDLVVLNCDLPELFGALLLSPQKLMAVEHINHPWITRKFFGRLVRKILKMRKTSWAAVSTHLTIWPEKEIPIGILLNPIFGTSSPEPSQSTHIQKVEKLKRLVFIGRLVEQKRPDWVFEIASQTKLPTEFIGDGLMFEDLKEKATRRNLPITFHGQVIDPWALVEKGDLLLIPSMYEGDGLVVLEALYREVPMLIADIPDFRRFRFPETNYCDSVGNFLKSIETIQNNLTELSIPKALSEQVLGPRSIQAVGDSWEKFIKSI
jgi:glycosyltransferase involved in cell wall biosynthesis